MTKPSSCGGSSGRFVPNRCVELARQEIHDDSIGRNLAFWLCSLLPVTVLSQSSPDLRFGGHTLGEPADVFFLTARVARSKQLTKDYCKALLDDSRVTVQAQQKDDVAKNGGVFVLNKQNFSVLDVGNCHQMSAALRGDKPI